MKPLIAILEDETDIRKLLVHTMEKAGYTALGFKTEKEFSAACRKKMPSLIILDLMLPDADGLDICKTLRADERYRHIPIIMLTAKAEETDKVLGLELGADDYVTKPFSPRELVARIKAALRKTTRHNDTKRITIGTVEIDTERFSVIVDGRPIDLTTTEFKILSLLASRPGAVFTREQIIDGVWSEDKIITDRTIDVHITNLRDKLGRAAGLIKSIRSIGYKMEE